MQLTEEWYFRPPYTSREEVEEAFDVVDSSRLDNFSFCPFEYNIKYELHKREARLSRYMITGSAIHEGLDYYYTTLEEAGSIDLAVAYWDDVGLEKEACPDKEAHLTAAHIRLCMEYYYDEWNRKRVDTYRPIDPPTMDQLDLSSVVAAKFRLTPDGHVVLGESNLLMEFRLGDIQFVMAGKPDLPVMTQDGALYIMDHKTTSSWISSWLWKRFDADNKMRCYIAMIDKLLPHVSPIGYVINALCVHPNIAKPTFSGTRSDRRKWRTTPSLVEEGLKNQLAHHEMIKLCRKMDFFPQGCERCRHPELCNTPPESRGVPLMLNFKDSDREFFDI